MVKGVTDSRQWAHERCLNGVDADRINIMLIRVALLHGRRYTDDEMGKSRLCQEKLCMTPVCFFLIFFILIYLFNHRHHGKRKARRLLLFVVKAAYKCLGIDIHFQQIFFVKFC